MIDNYKGIRVGSKLMALNNQCFWKRGDILTISGWRKSNNCHEQSFCLRGDPDSTRKFSPDWVIGGGSIHLFKILKIKHYISKL